MKNQISLEFFVFILCLQLHSKYHRQVWSDRHHCTILHQRKHQWKFSFWMIDLKKNKRQRISEEKTRNFEISFTNTDNIYASIAEYNWKQRRNIRMTHDKIDDDEDVRDRIFKGGSKDRLCFQNLLLIEKFSIEKNS